MTMKALIHRRKTGTNKSICGAGYDWPSGVRLVDKPESVTCRTCYERQEKS